MKKITDRQKEVLTIIKGYQKERGFAPSIRDISTKMNDISVSAVHRHLDALERKGQIRRDKRIARSITVV